MRITAILRSTETREIHAEGATYQEAKAALQVPEGWQIVAIREGE